MAGGIKLHILGDFGPFSRIGKSIGYQISVGDATYLIDCGAPLFQQIGGHGLQKVKGLFVTHAHDDHKRWFSDLALFNMYAPDVKDKVFFFTSEDINEDIMIAAAPALDRSLSYDSKTIVDIPYEDYVDYRIIGPKAKYRIARVEEGAGRSRLAILDRDGNEVGPEQAKIILHKGTKRPRMIFKDPPSGEWVEPESFYSFSSKIFYEDDNNIFTNTEEGFTIEAIKAPVWHGVPAIGLKVSTGADTLIFSSDTVNQKDLWEALCREKREQKLQISMDEFDSAVIIEGDINDYIERVWSQERYTDALTAFDEGVVIHDITIGAGAVHTEYHKLDNAALDKERTMLTHSPDRITSEWVLSNANKYYLIKGKEFFEQVDGVLKRMNADVYHKEKGKYYVGYKNDNGKYIIHNKNGILGVAAEEKTYLGKPVYRVDMYEDVSGKYYPMLDSDSERYWEGPDGRVELIKLTDSGSIGTAVEDQRDRLSGKG